MRLSAGFMKLASICALITVVTTLAIHLLPELWAEADTFAEQIELRRNPVYLARCWFRKF